MTNKNTQNIVKYKYTYDYVFMFTYIHMGYGIHSYTKYRIIFNFNIQNYNNMLHILNK